MVGQNEIPNKFKKRKNKSDLGDSFIAPDGGYGWMIILACGISNFCLYPCLQTFGIIYRDKLKSIGLTSSQITAIINTQQAISSCTGLFNGPLFRKFTYRQIALLGAIFATLGLFISSFANNFLLFLFSYSFLYGCGMGFSVSSASFVLNTYFKKYRRRATSFSWTITGIGPIVMPHVANICLYTYGYEGTVWLFSSIAMQQFVCAMTYQPVQWHVKTVFDKEFEEMERSDLIKENRCDYCKNKDKKFTNIENVSNGCRIKEKTNEMGNHEVTVNSNDGLAGSRSSLSSTKKLKSDIRSTLEPLNFEINGKQLSKDKLTESNENFNENVNGCTCFENKPLISYGTNKQNEDEKSTNLKWYQKVAIYFDLDLFKDITYVILMFGITFAMFAEMNFSVLTPFILKDFNFTDNQIALIMSVVGIVDVIVRFLLPFFAEKIKLSNQMFFMIGIVILTISRFFISFSPSYYITLSLFCLMGIGKALRTVFMGLIIPSHVTLKRLPAASGLQLLTAGIFTLLCGPLVGVIRDAANYATAISFLNLISLATVIVWSIQLLYRKCKKENIPKLPKLALSAKS